MSYSGTTAVAAEGSRVGFISCLKCGAAILLDPRNEVNMVDMHDTFHAEMETAK